MTTTTSRLPRNQRKAVFTATTFERRKRMSVPLSRELRRRFGRRQIPIRKGDTVRILSGSYIGREERVAKINRRSYSVTLDNVTGKTADAKLKPLPVQLNHLLLTKLNLSDPWRRRVLKVSDADVTPEETAPDAPPAPAAVEAPKAPAKEGSE